MKELNGKLIALGTVILAAVATAGCNEPTVAPGVDNEGTIAAAHEFLRDQNVVEVTAVHTPDGPRFEFSTHEIPSGWTTFRFRNEGEVTHFAILEKLPEGGTFEEAVNQVVPAFQEIMDLIIEEGLSPLDAFIAKIGEFPDWFLDPGYTFLGGPGLSAPGRTHQVTVNLEPGTYVIECYVKTPSGKFHSFLGMIEKLVVTDAASTARPPRMATLDLTISNTGFDAPEFVRPGPHIIGIHFAEQQVHGNFLLSDVHLVRLDDGADLAALNEWMDWSIPTGLATPAPNTFHAGIQDMPAGATGFVGAFLTPGDYAWIAEVDDPQSKNMLKTFTVPSRIPDRAHR